jgi:hypothetical protein
MYQKIYGELEANSGVNKGSKALLKCRTGLRVIHHVHNTTGQKYGLNPIKMKKLSAPITFQNHRNIISPRAPLNCSLGVLKKISAVNKLSAQTFFWGFLKLMQIRT